MIDLPPQPRLITRPYKETTEHLDHGEFEFPPLVEKSPGFATTHWSVVRSAGMDDPESAARALEALCQKYWYPIFAFIRRRGSDSHEAEDLTQAFFAQLLEKQAFRQADREKGKFRTFLLAALTNFLCNEWDKRQALKRGGGQHIVSLDETAAEERYRCEPVNADTPEHFFERRWAMTLLQQGLDNLKQECAENGKARLFASLEPLITGEVAPGAYARAAEELSMKEETVRVALSRLRRRFGELLRLEISHTVSSPAEVDGELRSLFAAISRGGS